jgi:hypothetical protein
MVLPQPYTTLSPKNALYSFSELQTGLGYREFYFGGYQEATTTYPILTTQQTAGSTSIAEATATPEYLTFVSSAFDLAATMKGRVYLDISGKVIASAGGNGVAWNCTYEIFKKRGVTSTSLGSGSITGYGAAVGTTYYLGLTGIIDITDEVYFAVGDQIEIKIGIYKTNAGGSATTGTCYFIADPLELDTSAIIKSRAYIPFLTE